MPYCDWGHDAQEIRILPTGGDSNIHCCGFHYLHQVRAWSETEPWMGPHWADLSIYDDTEPAPTTPTPEA